MHPRRKSNEFHFAVGVGACFQIKLADSGKAIGYVNFDSSSVDRLGVGRGYCEFQRAGPGGTINYGDLLRRRCT